MGTSTGERGSSPRTWGTPTRSPHLAERRLFIPTHVGNASTPGPGAICTAVHPHARGERQVRKYVVGWAGGSSPRTWGTPAAASPATAAVRFIPTHVGNASCRPDEWCPHAVHPHARGERGLLAELAGGCVGSSPRTWGTPGRWCCGASGRRFIPTHVGNAHHCAEWQ